MARRPVASPDRSGGGFTLVEILVVLAILATLIGMIAALIPRAMRAREQSKASSLVTSIGAALELLRNDNEQYGRYPPSRTRDLKIGKSPVGKEIGQPNDLNVGIECVHFLLNNPDIQVAQITADPELIGNTDEDSFRAARGTASDAFAREYLDPWGQPLVYFHSNDYKDPKGLAQVRTAGGETIEVRPKKLSAKSGGNWLNPNSFQLFSVGPNGRQDGDDDEESDDIVFQGR